MRNSQTLRKHHSFFERQSSTGKAVIVPNEPIYDADWLIRGTERLQTSHKADSTVLQVSITA